MPKINLLPQDRAERNRTRKGWMGTAFVAILFVALLGATFAFFKGQELAAQDALAAQQAENRALQTEISALEPYRELKSRYEDGSVRVTAALDGDVAWGRLLGDFGRMISDKRVWMSNLSVNSTQVGAVPGVYGSVAMSGEGFDYPDVSSWLLTLDSQDWDGVTGAWAAAVSQDESESGSLVSWTLTTSITDGALSDRVEVRIPEVTE